MKISVNDQELYTLTQTQCDVINNQINSDEFEADMKRRLEWVLLHKYQTCFDELKKQWESILAQRYESLPTNQEAFAQLVFSQPDYKDRKQRDAEAIDSLI